MLKCLILSVFTTLLAFGGGGAFAEEFKGKVKSADADKATVTLTVGDKNLTFSVAKDAEIYSLGKAKKGQSGRKKMLSGGLSELKEGTEVTATTVPKENKEVVTSILVQKTAKKKKKSK